MTYAGERMCGGRIVGNDWKNWNSVPMDWRNKFPLPDILVKKTELFQKMKALTSSCVSQLIWKKIVDEEGRVEEGELSILI